MSGLLLRLNPLVLLTIGASAFTQALFLQTLPTVVVALSLWAVLAVVFLPTWRFPMLALGIAVFSGLMVTYSTWRSGVDDVELLAVAGLRIVVLAWPGSAVLCYLDPARLGDYLGQSLRLPARPVAAFSVGLQRFDQLAVVLGDSRRARRARGVAPSGLSGAWIGHITGLAFVVLVAALRGAMWSAIAMDARGFATAHDRSWAEPATWTRADRLGMLVLGAVTILPFVVITAM